LAEQTQNIIVSAIFMFREDKSGKLSYFYFV